MMVYCCIHVFWISPFWGRFSWNHGNREKHDSWDLRFCRFCRFHDFDVVDMLLTCCCCVVVVKSVNKHVHRLWHGLWHRVQSTSILVSCFDDIWIMLFGVDTSWYRVLAILIILLIFVFSWYIVFCNRVHIVSFFM